MPYFSQVVIAIGGTPEKIRQYVETVESILSEYDKKQFYYLFQIIEDEENFSFFIFYSEYFEWQERHNQVWQILRGRAIKAELSYIFYRLGGAINDATVEERETNNEHFHLLQASISLHRRISLGGNIASKYLY